MGGGRLGVKNCGRWEIGGQKLWEVGDGHPCVTPLMSYVHANVMFDGCYHEVKFREFKLGYWKRKFYKTLFPLTLWRSIKSISINHYNINISLSVRGGCLFWKKMDCVCEKGGAIARFCFLISNLNVHILKVHLGTDAESRQSW